MAGCPLREADSNWVQCQGYSEAQADLLFSGGLKVGLQMAKEKADLEHDDPQMAWKKIVL